MISVHFQSKPFNFTAIQVYAPTTNTKDEVDQFYDDLQDLLELTPKKDVLFIIGDWNAKERSQETPGIVGKFGFGVQTEAGPKANRALPRKCTGHSKHTSTTQNMTLHWDITKCSILK